MWFHILFALVLWYGVLVYIFEITFSLDEEGFSMWYWKTVGHTNRLPKQVLIWKRKSK